MLEREKEQEQESILISSNFKDVLNDNHIRLSIDYGESNAANDDMKLFTKKYSIIKSNIMKEKQKQISKKIEANNKPETEDQRIERLLLKGKFPGRYYLKVYINFIQRFQIMKYTKSLK